ncbi:condensin subunit ScpA [Paraoerskovia marina]|uniref:Segregation and condensation protein A n=1 Tax=Paraoerskovia marina TaxID=545619 RepID=A0A1H1T2B7_9CELL|nr:ScpA family protein [Paraoerskovia marina]SDS54253.1 condensin subunit ScpA [Paraoerskovia marina]
MASTTAVESPPTDGGFEVHLDNFEGPFDLLLSLIAKHRLDITEIALARVTDEFIAHTRAAESTGRWTLGAVSEFLLVAATLLDLKAARLLPTGDVEDREDLELLEARDLLFARLLQYRAYKVVAGDLGARYAEASLRYPRVVPLEPHLAALLPELVWRTGPERLAEIAAAALAPPPEPPTVDVAHLHGSAVSVREQAGLVADRLREAGALTFRSLVAGEDTPVVVARFLALLELFRQGAVGFDQVTPLGELTVRWAADSADVEVTDEFDTTDGVGPATTEER